MAGRAKRAPRADLADSEPTPYEEAFADWLVAETGVDVELETARLALALAGPFRHSDAAAKAKAEMAATLQKAKDAKRSERADKIAARAADLARKAQELKAKADELRPADELAKRRNTSKSRKPAKAAAPAPAAPAQPTAEPSGEDDDEF